MTNRWYFSIYNGVPATNFQEYGLLLKSPIYEFIEGNGKILLHFL